MEVQDILVGKSIKIYSEKNQFILENDILKLSLSKVDGAAIPAKDFITQTSPYSCYGIVGCMEGKTQNYLVYIDEVDFISTYLGANVYEIKKFNYIPYDTDQIEPNDFVFIQMMNDFLERNSLYYSDKLDLSLSFQSIGKRLENDPQAQSHDSEILRFSNDIYCWNRFLIYPYNRYYKQGYKEGQENNEGMQYFAFPIINGFFGSCKGNEYNDNVELFLIARKDVRRSGMRFLIRGADKDGNTANCVEIEEVLVYKENDNVTINSFVQMRGSIPLLWTQEPTVKLNPKIKVNENFVENYNAFSIHINELIERYDSVHCINLIDKKKDQLIIGKEYEKLVMEYKSKELKNGGKLEFSWFDFHSECKKMQYNNIKKLFLQENVSKNLENCKYNIISINLNKFKEEKSKLEEQKIFSHHEEILIQNDLLIYNQNQKVVFRTNCIDSLDRTNVVQSVFGRYFLLLILKDLKLSDASPSKENISLPFKEGFENKFKNIWADVGDHVSLAYSGTGAMKSDFVRTGKRTIFGALNDGILTTRRLFINNFRDGYNQDCHDYFLGNLNPKKDIIKQHSLTNMYAVFAVAAVFSLQLTRMMTSGGLSLMNLLLFLILTFIIGFSLIYSMKKQFIDYHSKHSKK